jgi:signal transduction histidine kinase
VGLQVLAAGLQRQGRTVQLSADDAGQLPPAAAAMLYRCALEAVRNVAAHSNADDVQISLERVGRTATLVVADDGVGFDEARLVERSAAGHLGLRALTDLLGEAGGSLTATSAPGRGTRLVATIPLPAPDRAAVAAVALAGAGA